MKFVMSANELAGRSAQRLLSFTQYLLYRLGIILESTSLIRSLHPHAAVTASSQ